MRLQVGRALCSLLVICVATAARAQDPLPSWNEGPTKQAILDFVAKVTKQGGPDFVPVEQRIATFDNDGTLWCEMPMYVQLNFAFDRVKTLAPEHPEWKDQEPFKSILTGDYRTALADGEKSIMLIMMSTHAGMDVQDYHKLVADWMPASRHPRFKRPYTDLVYQPMLEVLAYFRANGFKTFIVSGGGVEFMRPWTEKSYGVVPEQVVGSSIKTKYELRDGRPILMRLPEVNFIDDKQGKPIGINEFIGRRPIAAFGNSDGDLEMLQWTTAGSGARLGLIVHHTDAEREYAYDRDSDVGRLNKALDDAPKNGWVIMDMKRDWKVIFPFEKK